MSLLTLCRSFDFFQALLELFPVIHDGLRLALLRQHLGHVLHLLPAFFDAVDTDVGNQWDARSHGGGGAASTVLDCDALLRFDPEFLAGVQVNLRVRFARRRVEAGGRAVDVFQRKVLVDADLLQGRDDTRFGAGAHHRHRVSLLLEPLQLFWCTRARGGLLTELLRHRAQLALDIVIQLLIRQLEVVFFLQPQQHASKILAHEILEETVDVIPGRYAMLFEKLVGQVRTGFESQSLREDKSIIAVEENVFDLCQSAVERGKSGTGLTLAILDEIDVTDVEMYVV